MAYIPKVGYYFFYDWPREIAVIQSIKGTSVKTKHLLLIYGDRKRVKVIDDEFPIAFFKRFKDPKSPYHRKFDLKNLLEIISLTKKSTSKSYKEFLKGAFLKLIED